jgi:hypothetical protein
VNASTHREKLVVVLCVTPLLQEAVTTAVGDLATVAAIAPRGHDAASLIGWIDADAVIVETESDADAASEAARATGTSLVQIGPAQREVRFLTDDGWVAAAPTGGSAIETLRGVLANRLLHARATRRSSRAVRENG